MMLLTAAVDALWHLARNLYDASGGHVHGASGICLGQVFYQWYLERAIQEAAASGRHPWDILAEEFGMTREEFEQYVYDHDYSEQWEDMHELDAWKEAHDPVIQLTHMLGGR